MNLPKNSTIIFKGIVGSQSYGLATETSDIDIKGVYIQPTSDILSNRYVPQVDLDKDTVYYELRRFLELVSVGNPNVLELLYLPERCIILYSGEWDAICETKSYFLSKKCYDTFSGYAKTQMRKARGLNKKYNWEASKVIRKDITDFCHIIEGPKSIPIKKLLDIKDIDSSGVTKVSNARDVYCLHVDNRNKFNFRGISKENSNQIRLSSIPKEYFKEYTKDYVYNFHFNEDGYSSHCKDYREYKEWLEKRNEDRVAINKKHGQQFDSKNLLHVVRLIMTAQEIPTENRINVDRSKNREYLLSIKRGDVDLGGLIEEWSKKAEDLKELYVNSDLKDEVDIEFIRNLELKIRTNGKL